MYPLRGQSLPTCSRLYLDKYCTSMLTSPVIVSRHSRRTSRPLSTRSRSHFGSLYGLSSACRQANRAILFLFTLLRTLLHRANLNSFVFKRLRTLCTKTAGVGGSPSSNFQFSLMQLRKRVGKQNRTRCDHQLLTVGGKTIFQNSGAGDRNSTGTSDPS